MPGPTSEPLVEAGTSPHRIMTPSDSLSCMRAAGTLCVAATLKRVEKVHHGLLTLSSCSTSPRSGMTILSHMTPKRTTESPDSELSAHCDKRHVLQGQRSFAPLTLPRAGAQWRHGITSKNEP